MDKKEPKFLVIEQFGTLNPRFQLPGLREFTNFSEEGKTKVTDPGQYFLAIDHPSSNAIGETNS